MPPHLSANSYGKSEVRLTKVIRKGPLHELIEFAVDIELTGDFASSYTQGDNSKIIATDSMKNTVYVLAKEREFDSAEQFAMLLAEHFLTTYAQVKESKIAIRQTAWKRIDLDGKPHDHAFIADGPELRTAAVSAARSQPAAVSGGIGGLIVLKTTNSAFKQFVTDRYRTLKDADDRIFATSVTATWDYQHDRLGHSPDFNSVHDRIRGAMLRVFATHMSFAVQETMYEMGKAALAAAPEISRISLRLPNQHRIPINLQPFGLENNNEIFVWTDKPFGDIRATIDRD